MDRNKYITDQQVVDRAKAAVKIAIERKKALQLPFFIYDREDKKIYQVNPDGSKIIVADTANEERYSERCKKEA